MQLHLFEAKPQTDVKHRELLTPDVFNSLQQPQILAYSLQITAEQQLVNSLKYLCLGKLFYVGIFSGFSLDIFILLLYFAA